MTVGAPRSRSPRPPSRGQLRRVEQEISRFIRRRPIRPIRLEAVRQWADRLLTRERARWILLRAASTGPRQRLAVTARSLRKTLNAGPRPQRPPDQAKHRAPACDVSPASGPRSTALSSPARPPRRERLESVIVWLCLALVVVCGILLFAAGRELRQLNDNAADSRAQVRILYDRIARLEKEAQTLRRASEAPARPKIEKSAFTLTRDEERLVRQFIKVLPSQSAATTIIEPGQSLGTMSTAPIPDALVEQIPRLSGARFSIDPSGAIIISRAGSSLADVVVDYAQ